MNVLDSSRSKLADARRTGTLPRRPRSSFAGPDDEVLARAFDAESVLLGKGDIVFGAVLQPLAALCKRGAYDGGGYVVYSHERWVDAAPWQVEGIRDWICGLAGERQPHPTLDALASALGTGTAIGRTAIPTGHTFNTQYYICAIPILRADLPGAYLRTEFLPILASPAIESALPLPLPLWGENLVQAWIDRGA